MKQVTYYFSPVSGFAYVGHRAFLDMAKELGAEVNFRPFDILAIFASQGTVPPPKQGDMRLSYRREDMARWATFRGLPLNAVPAHWPTPSIPGSSAIIAAGEMGLDMGDVAETLMRGTWVEDKNIAVPEDITALLNAAGFPAEDILALSQEPQIQETLLENARLAEADKVFGSPTYVVDGERFYGQDRLEFVAAALESD